MPAFEQLTALPEWIVVVGLAPWWLRRVLELARDVDVYLAERRGRACRAGGADRMTQR